MEDGLGNDPAIQEIDGSRLFEIRFDYLCLVQADEAIATLDAVISKASESESQTLAEAWLLKGDCFRSKNLPKDALMAYLHVDVLYASEPAAHAEALFRLAALWAPSGHQDRSDDAQARLTEKYPNSSWAKTSDGAAP